MDRYRVVGARPKGETNHLKSEFRVYQWAVDPKDGVKRWTSCGWQSVHRISDHIASGAEVLSGKVVDGRMRTGAPLELELRIAINGSDFRIGEMPAA